MNIVSLAAKRCAALLLVSALCALPTLHASMAHAQERVNNTPLSVVFEPKEQAVIAAEAPGRVIMVSKEMGEPFAKGDVLVKLDAQQYEANLSRAKASAGATSEALSVTRKLRGYQSASKLDEVNARKEAAAASADLRLAQHEMDATTIEAPFNGFVQRTLVREFEYVEKGQPVVEVVDDSIIRVNILMPASAWKDVRTGQSMTVAVTETGETVPCTITHVSQVLDPGSNTFEVFGEVDNSNKAIRSGMTGTVITN